MTRASIGWVILVVAIGSVEPVSGSEVPQRRALQLNTRVQEDCELAMVTADNNGNQQLAYSEYLDFMQILAECPRRVVNADINTTFTDMRCIGTSLLSPSNCSATAIDISIAYKDSEERSFQERQTMSSLCDFAFLALPSDSECAVPSLPPVPWPTTPNPTPKPTPKPTSTPQFDACFASIAQADTNANDYLTRAEFLILMRDVSDCSTLESLSEDQEAAYTGLMCDCPPVREVNPCCVEGVATIPVPGANSPVADLSSDQLAAINKVCWAIEPVSTNGCIPDVELALDIPANFDECLTHMLTADDSNDWQLTQEEYLEFVRLVTSCDSLTVLSSALTTVFADLSCQCLDAANADPDCCLPRNARVSITGADDTDRSIPDTNALIVVCTETTDTAPRSCPTPETDQPTPRPTPRPVAVVPRPTVPPKRVPDPTPAPQRPVSVPPMPITSAPVIGNGALFQPVTVAPVPRPRVALTEAPVNTESRVNATQASNVNSTEAITEINTTETTEFNTTETDQVNSTEAVPNTTEALVVNTTADPGFNDTDPIEVLNVNATTANDTWTNVETGYTKAPESNATAAPMYNATAAPDVNTTEPLDFNMTTGNSTMSASEPGTSVVASFETTTDTPVRIPSRLAPGETMTVVNEPTSGTMSVADDGTINYSPSAGFDGVDSINLQICNAEQSTCRLEQLTITVQATQENSLGIQRLSLLAILLPLGAITLAWNKSSIRLFPRSKLARSQCLHQTIKMWSTVPLTTKVKTLYVESS